MLRRVFPLLATRTARAVIVLSSAVPLALSTTRGRSALVSHRNHSFPFTTVVSPACAISTSGQTPSSPAAPTSSSSSSSSPLQGECVHGECEAKREVNRNGRQHEASTQPTPTASDGSSSSSASMPRESSELNNDSPSSSFASSPIQPDSLPSARQLREQLPSLEELQAQLQKSLDRDGPYATKGGIVFQKTVDRLDEDFSVSLPMQPAVDEGEDLSTEKDKYILFAYKALLWGTFYSIVGVGCLTMLLMYVFNLHSIEDVLQKVREKTQRDMTLLRIKGEESTGSVTVRHYDLDFTQPTKVWEQVQEIWSLVVEEVERVNDVNEKSDAQKS